MIKQAIASLVFLVFGLSALNVLAQETHSDLVRIIPEGMSEPPHFALGILDTRTKTLYVSGQIAVDENLNVIGEGDLARQMEVVYAGLSKVLEAAGTHPGNVIEQRTFIVGIDENTLPIYSRINMDFYGNHKPRSTTIGTDALLIPGALVEIDITALVE